MPSKGQKQKTAGIKLPTPPLHNGMKTMVCGKGFKIEPQKYKGNPVFAANK